MTANSAQGGKFWNPWRIGGWSTALGLLLLPAIAMRFTTEMAWTIADFLFAAMTVAIVGLGIELAVRATRSSSYRIGAGVAMLTGVLVIWINGAVGIIGNEDHPANLLFFSVIALAIGGAFVAHFSARGLSRAMTVSGVAQMLVPPAAMAIWSIPLTVDLVKTLAFNAVLAAFWLFSAWQFRRAPESPEPLINVN